MRITIELILLAAAWFFQAAKAPPPGFREFSHDSSVLNTKRTYRVALPNGYDQSTRRYPVVYWLRSENAVSARDSRLASYAATHELIVVDVAAGDQGPFVLYFPELVDQVDRTLHTLADRGHRAISGFANAGFMAYYLAGKYPDLVGSVSSINGTMVSDVGPEAFPVEYSLDELASNYDGIRTRMVRSTADFQSYLFRRMNSFWAFTRPAYETGTFLTGHDLAEIEKTLDFHEMAFAAPLPQPQSFQHVDPYPNFEVWGWEVLTNRRQPGVTVLENVSNQGLRLSVREYVGGPALPEVTVSIGSAPIFPPGVALTVTCIHLIDGKVKRIQQRADARGRLNFDLTGDAWEVAVSSAPLLAISDVSVTDANWATAGEPLHLKVRFWNKGGAATGTSLIQWESPNPGVKFTTPQGRLYALAPGEAATLPITVTISDKDRAVLKIFGVAGANRMPFEVPLYPAAEPAKDFQIADGRAVTAFQHATAKTEQRFGEGNGDGHAAPGESFAVLLPDSGGLRAAEVITNDPCIEAGVRGTDSWPSGGSVRFSMPSVRLDCEPGHVVKLLARILVPTAGEPQMKYTTVEFPVWYRNELKK